MKEELDTSCDRTYSRDDRSSVAESFPQAFGSIRFSDRSLFDDDDDDQNVNHCADADDHSLNSSPSDQLQLTQLEIDAICSHELVIGAEMTLASSSPSTPNSLHSHPDFFDPRPDIYRFAYNISPVSRTSIEDTVAQVGNDLQPVEADLSEVPFTGTTSEQCSLPDGNALIHSDGESRGMQKNVCL